MNYKCPKCGGSTYYFQQVQTGNRVYDFNPTDSTDVSGDLIPNQLQVPGQVFVDPVMKQVAFCKTCPSPVQMSVIKPVKDPLNPWCASALVVGILQFLLIWFYVPALPIILAAVGLTQISKSTEPVRGKGLAIAAIILGVVAPWWVIQIRGELLIF